MVIFYWCEFSIVKIVIVRLKICVYNFTVDLEVYMWLSGNCFGLFYIEHGQTDTSSSATSADNLENR